MMNLLAEVAADTQISGNWVLELIAKLFVGLGVLVTAVWAAYKKGQAAPVSNLTLPDPLPEFVTRTASTPPSWDAHKALVDRVMRQEQISNELRHDLSEVRKEMAKNYRDLITAGQARETNLSDKLDGIARSIHSRIDDLMTANTSR